MTTAILKTPNDDDNDPTHWNNDDFHDNDVGEDHCDNSNDAQIVADFADNGGEMQNTTAQRRCRRRCSQRSPRRRWCQADKDKTTPVSLKKISTAHNDDYHVDGEDVEIVAVDDRRQDGDSVPRRTGNIATYPLAAATIHRPNFNGQRTSQPASYTITLTAAPTAAFVKKSACAEGTCDVGVTTPGC